MGCLVFSGSASAQPLQETRRLVVLDKGCYVEFGASVAISDGLCISGAPFAFDNGFESGVVYVHDAESGSLVTTLYPGDPGDEDDFGWSVAADGEMVLVGAPGKYGPGFNPNRGAAYLYAVSTNTELACFVPPDWAAYDKFGWSVDLAGSIAVIGSPEDDDNGSSSGSAYIYDLNTQEFLFKILPSDGEQFDQFGYSVAISSSYIAVASPYRNAINDNEGSVYIFDTKTGGFLYRIDSPSVQPGTLFGGSVSLDGDLLLVGAPWESGDSFQSGLAYLYDLGTNSAEQLFRFRPSVSAEGAQFGSAVAVSGRFAVVGAMFHPGGGSAYVFDTSSGEELYQLIGSDLFGGESLGRDVAVSGSITVCGAPWANDPQDESGVVYVYDLGVACLADVNGDGVVTPTDFNAWINAFNNNLPTCDQNGDGQCTPTDFNAWIANFNAGCG